MPWEIMDTLPVEVLRQQISWYSSTTNGTSQNYIINCSVYTD